jgi:hypothetical protein
VFEFYQLTLIIQLMERKVSILVISVLFFLTSCEKGLVENDELNASAKKSALHESGLQGEQIAGGLNKGHVVLNFRAHLSGDQEVPPRETLATGQAVFQLSKDGTELRYKLIVANLENITMAHIHVAPAGTNGGVVAWLYPPAPPASLISGTTNGILQQGVIRKANLVGILAGHELSELVDLMLDDKTYANVHTSLYPGGEIRGQISGNGIKAD